MLVMVMDEVPPLVRVTTWAGELVVPTDWLPYVNTVAESPTDPKTPVPIKLTACGLPPVALSAMVTAAVRLPEADGVNVTVTVQNELAAKELGEMGQLLLWLKSPALVPVTEMLETVKLRLPVFVSVKL